MPQTSSAMLPLGTPAPAFALLDTISGRSLSLEQLKSGRATVVMFICNHCPYVKHVLTGLVAVAQDYQPRGVAFIAISSNDVLSHPDDGPDQMKRVGQAAGFPFPYLYDESQQVARAYQAACTPDFYVFDSALKLAYRGQFDDSRPGNGKPVSGRDLRQALDALLAGAQVPGKQVPSVGCNIKWVRARA
jgi:peroxiredoxin